MVKTKLSSGKEIYLDGYLMSQLDSLVYNVRNDWDFVIVITGDRQVRTGKSVLAMNVCAYLADRLKTSFSEENIFFDSQEMMDKAQQMPINSVIQYDEARESLAASKSMLKLQQDILDFFNECGQLNHIFVLVLPDFFTLKEEMAVGRSECLINVYRTPTLINKDIYGEGKTRPLVRFDRGRFEFFNRKKKAYLYDKAKSTRQKNYGLIKANFVGSFTNNYPIDEELYRQKKAEALARFKEKKAKEKAMGNKRYREHLRLGWYLLKKQGVTVQQMITHFENYLEEPFGKRVIQEAIKEYGERVDAQNNKSTHYEG